MNRRIRMLMLPWGLGLLTLVVLLADIPSFDKIDTLLWLLFAALVGLMLNLSATLDEVLISPAPTAALMTYLTIGEGEKAPAALWSVALGALTGNLIWLARNLPQHSSTSDYTRAVRSATISTAQLTIGLFCSGWAYRQFGGRLPLDQLESADVLALAAFVLIYLAIYLSILLLESYLYRLQTPRTVARNWQSLVGIALLPVPFGVVGATAYHELSSLAFAVLIGGLLIIVTGVRQFSQAQARSHQQVLELSALSAVSRAMHTNLDLNALLDLVYQQVANLLNVNTFTVALVDPNRNTIYFPLNVRNHQHVPLEPREVQNGLLEWVIRTKSPLLLPDKVARRAEEMGVDSPDAAIYSWMGVPLVAPDRVLGCMAIHATRPEQHFTAADLQLLTNIAAQTGITIDNAQLYGQARDRAVQLATLNNISVILSGTLDVEQILELAGSSAVAVASCDGVALYLWDVGERRKLLLARHNGLSDRFASAAPMPLLLDIDDLQRRRQPVIVTDVHGDQRTHDLQSLMDHENKRAWIEFLLRKGEDLLGILVFFYNESR
ncbi:MAG: GAF domain-containing protein, partial [Chloroflexi bacterium]|nr:GAF domain-containing protein [Chloroflexota bacterium]